MQEAQAQLDPRTIVKQAADQVITKAANIRNTENPIDYVGMIDALNQQYDEQQGIFQYLVGETLIRDAREREGDSYTDNKEDCDKIAYKMQFINNCRGAEIVCELEGKKKPNLMGIAEAVFKYPKNRENLITALRQLEGNKMAKALANKMERKKGYAPNIKELNSILIAELKNKGIKNARKKATAAAEFGNFEQDHRNIVTLSKVDGATIQEASIKVNPLEGTLMKDFLAIAEITLENGKKIPKQKIKWFDALEPFQKKLVIKYALEIASGSRVIPTQLLKILPGLRNAYLHEVTVIKPEQGVPQQPQQVLSVLRCGAPAYYGKDAVEVTKQNLEAASDALGSSENVHLHQLITHWQPGDDNRKAGRVIDKATKEPIPAITKKTIAAAQIEGRNVVLAQTTFKVAKMPANKLRTVNLSEIVKTLFRPRNKAYDQALKIFAEALLAEENRKLEKDRKLKKDVILSQVLDYIKTGKGADIKIIDAYLESMESDKSVDAERLAALRNLVECRRLLSSTVTYPDKENSNATLSARMLKASQDMQNTGVLGKDLDPKVVEKFPKDVVYCKSGKDRTGLVVWLASVMGVSACLGSDKQEEVAQTLAYSGHQAAIAGQGGGTPGAFGQKPDTIEQMPEAYKKMGVAGALGRETADANKFPVLSTFQRAKTRFVDMITSSRSSTQQEL